MNIVDMNYSEFCLFVSETDKAEYILSYDDWSVVKIDSRFYYYEHEVEGDSDVFFEVSEVATLNYNINNDIKSTDNLHSLFDCDICGEQITDNNITYWWFKKVQLGSL